MARPAGLEPATPGLEGPPVGFYEPSPGNNWQYLIMSQSPKNRAKRYFSSLSPRVAKKRPIPSLFVVQCDASVTGESQFTISPSRRRELEFYTTIFFLKCRILSIERSQYRVIWFSSPWIMNEHDVFFIHSPWAHSVQIENPT